MLFSALRHPRRGDPDAYEWDENKRMENREKHGIDFANMSRFDWDSAIFKPPWRHEEGKEWRQTAIGYIDDDTDDRRLYVAVFTERGKKMRIISLYPANRKNRKRYNQERGSRPEE